MVLMAHTSAQAGPCGGIPEVVGALSSWLSEDTSPPSRRAATM